MKLWLTNTVKTKKQEELEADIRYFWSEFRTRDDAEDGSSLRKGSKQYKQPCDDIFKKVSAVLEPTPWVAKFLDKRKREDDMETDTDLSCCQINNIIALLWFWRN